MTALGLCRSSLGLHGKATASSNLSVCLFLTILGCCQVQVTQQCSFQDKDMEVFKSLIQSMRDTAWGLVALAGSVIALALVRSLSSLPGAEIASQGANRATVRAS